jgi:histidine triad (HIT) family protein
MAIRGRTIALTVPMEVSVPAEDCLFCKIVAAEVPAKIVRETERTLAFRDINPQAPTHVLVVTKEHYPTVADLAAADADLLAEVLSEAHQVAVDEGVADGGYRVVFNTGAQAGQTVFHVHGHVLGGRGLNWPPG